MVELKINAKYLHPAPGWKCFQCAYYETGTTEISEVPVLGWGVVEGHRDGPQMELLVAPQDCGFLYPPGASTAHDLMDYGPDNCVFAFVYGELDDESKATLEEEARNKCTKAKDKRNAVVSINNAFNKLNDTQKDRFRATFPTLRGTNLIELPDTKLKEVMDYLLSDEVNTAETPEVA
jgi:hypothetical protein